MQGRLLSTVGLAVLLAACGTQDDGGPGDPSDARLRVINARAADPVDVLLGDITVANDLRPAHVSAYTSVPAGRHTLSVRVNGSVVGTQPITLSTDTAHTIVIDESPADDGLRAVLGIDTASAPAPGKVKLRVIHLAPNAPPIDVYLTTADADLATAVRYAFPFRYGTGSSEEFPGYVERDPGQYRVRFTAEGALDVLLDTGPFPVEVGQVRTVVLAEGPGGGIRASNVDED